MWSPVSALRMFSLQVVRVATLMRYSYENSDRVTTKPSFLRRQESIFGVSPSVPQETQRPTSFSFQVVRVTTLMRYSERSLLPLSFL